MDKIFEIDSLEIFQKVSQNILTNLYYSEQTPRAPLEADVIEEAKQELILIFTDSNFDADKLETLFYSRGWQQDKVQCFLDLLKNNMSDILNTVFNHFNSNYCETVVNFGWLVKLILGTSELKGLKYPLFQLILSILDKNRKETKIVYDINKDLLMKMINALENIQ